MSNVATMPPQVNGILETSLYVESPARSAEFYRRVFGFERLEPGEPLNDETRLCPMRAGDRSVLLLFKKGATADRDAIGAIHIAFGIARCDCDTGRMEHLLTCAFQSMRWQPFDGAWCLPKLVNIAVRTAKIRPSF